MPNADEIRAAQRETWAKLSAGWEKWDSVITEQLGPVGTAMIERLDIAADQRHLDIASGTGEPGLSIAKLAPQGRVVLTDLAAEMLEVAARRARSQSIVNVETQVCSADDLPFDDATFDSVSVRFGYMFFPDVAQATAEFTRVLKPGGRLCSSVWVELVTESPAQYWEMISEHVSLAVAALQQVDELARERIRATAMAKARAFEQGGEVRVPGRARCIVGTR